MTFSVPDTVPAGQSFIVTWTAEPSDPEGFRLDIGENPGVALHEINVTRAGQTTGVVTIPPLTSPGGTRSYHAAAISDQETFIEAVNFQVINPPDISAPVLKHQPLRKIAPLPMCFPLKKIFSGSSKIFSESSITSSQPSQSHGSVEIIMMAIAKQVMHTDRFSTGTSEHSPTNLNPPLSTTSHSPSHVPIIVGSTLGVIIVLMMTMGLLIIRHRRSRLLKIPVFPYELSGSEDTGTRSRVPRAVLNWQQRHLRINNPADVTGNGEKISSEKAPIAPEPVPSEDTQTERQRSLQAQAVEMERQLADLEPFRLGSWTDRCSTTFILSQ
ncbi:hypothetical protein C8J56DRAFT_903107 [Mycena floridula]|nr:hypothetical protein C8J56DRAFT_903107 [Mycena floridula]